MVCFVWLQSGREDDQSSPILKFIQEVSAVHTLCDPLLYGKINSKRKADLSSCGP